MDKVILPKTLLEAVKHFSDFDNCHQFMTILRWPDGVIRCPRCGSENVSYLPNARVYKCYEKHDKNKFSLKVGTIFEDSPIGLDKWLPVMWMVVNCKNGISSYEVSRDLGVTQKSAWFMLQRARLAMQGNDGGKLGDDGVPVEVDETFIGGKARNMHKSRRDRLKATDGLRPGGGGKTIVLGMLKRKGTVRTAVISDRKKKTVEPIIRRNIEQGAELHSDEFQACWWSDKDFIHQVVNHAEKYVNGTVHTNGMENFWSLLKRGLSGTYVSVEPFHLFRYLDEHATRAFAQH